MHSLQIYQVCVSAVSWHLHICKLICIRNWKQLIEAIRKRAFKSCDRVICIVKDGKVLNLLQVKLLMSCLWTPSVKPCCCCFCFLIMLFLESGLLRPLFWSSFSCQLSGRIQDRKHAVAGRQQRSIRKGSGIRLQRLESHSILV